MSTHPYDAYYGAALAIGVRCPSCRLPVDPDSPNTVRSRRRYWHGSCWASDNEETADAT
jgi:hypothetical protein